MNIRAYLGGSFNPIHQGHIQIAKETCELLSLARVTLIPGKNNNLKTLDQSITEQIRLKQIEQAVQNTDFLTVDYRELNSKQDKSYTIDTLKLLKKDYPENKFVIVMGSDTFEQFYRWKEWQRIIQYTNLLVFKRANHHPKKQYNPEFTQWVNKYQLKKEDFIHALYYHPAPTKNHLLIIEMKQAIAISSSQIRLTNKTFV